VQSWRYLSCQILENGSIVNCCSCTNAAVACRTCLQMTMNTANWKLFINTTHTHTRLTALYPGLPGWAGTRKVKPIWILMKQETVSGSGISWTICKSAPHSRQITTPAPHRSVFTGWMPFLPPNQQCQSTQSKKHWRQTMLHFKLTAAVMYHIPNTCSLRGYGHDKTLTNTIQSVTVNNTDWTIQWL